MKATLLPVVMEARAVVMTCLTVVPCSAGVRQNPAVPLQMLGTPSVPGLDCDSVAVSYWLRVDFPLVLLEGN